MNLNKKIQLAVIAFSAVFVFSSLDIESTGGAPAARTGSPADGFDCTSCHGGAATSVTGLITSTIPASGYVPGSVYTITATISDPLKNQFGFEISPQKTSGAQVGTMTITDAIRTQLVGTGKYVTHKSAGTTGTNNSTSWSFQWTAPQAGTGSFTFYGAFLAGNANGLMSGDAVILSTLYISEDVGASVSEENIKSFSIYPNPANNFVFCNVKSDAEINLRVCSAEGRPFKQMHFNKGEIIKADITELNSGLYIIQIDKDGKKYSGKFIKE